jgi:small subunit ribosomal protein S8
MSDSISDFITIIRNAYKAGKEICIGKHSGVHESIARILQEEGYIREVKVVSNEKGHRSIQLTLKYVNEIPALTGIKRASRPGRRIYFPAREIPRTLGGLGVGILTTSKGVVKDRDARRQNIGGELICTVW